MALEFTTSYLQDTLALLRYYKRMADRAMEQVTDSQLYAALDGETNSIAITVKHIAGNQRSLWTDFLTSDGEKADRNRDGEFVDPPGTRAALLGVWEEGWRTLFDALEPLKDGDLSRTVKIRGEAHSVLQAINRQTTDYACQFGQIILLEKHFAGEDWQSLTIPRGQSDAYRRQVGAGERWQR